MIDFGRSVDPEAKNLLSTVEEISNLSKKSLAKIFCAADQWPDQARLSSVQQQRLDTIRTIAATALAELQCLVGAQSVTPVDTRTLAELRHFVAESIASGADVTFADGLGPIAPESLISCIFPVLEKIVLTQTPAILNIGGAPGLGLDLDICLTEPTQVFSSVDLSDISSQIHALGGSFLVEHNAGMLQIQLPWPE